MFKSNNVYICHLEKDVKRFNKQFHHTVTPSNYNMSISEVPDNTKYSTVNYKRGVDTLEKRVPTSYNNNTLATMYAESIDNETNLYNADVKNNADNFNSYVPNMNGDLYSLNTPYQKRSGPHDLLFDIPKFSSSCTPPVNDILPFNNFTREQRNNI
jgi:hypothetical protein